MKPLQAVDLANNPAYVGGYIDGEGCFRIFLAVSPHNKLTYGTWRIQTQSGDVDLLVALHEVHGGSFSKVKRRGRQNDKVQLYSWDISGKEAVTFCKPLLLLSKSPQRDYFLESYERYHQLSGHERGDYAKIAKEHLQHLKTWNHYEATN